MKNIRLLVLMGILTTMGLSDCGVYRGDRGKDLQRLSKIEVYTSDGQLVNTILDEEILGRFYDLDDMDISSDTDVEMDALQHTVGDLDELCTIISYKTPVAAWHDGSLEKWMELTVYEDSNIIKEQIAPETIKGGYVSEEFLTFYVMVSDEDKAFILSLMEGNRE